VRAPDSRNGRCLTASLFGLSRFDGAGYVASLEESARRFSWTVPAERTRRRQTASALIVREGKILLERRSAGAKSHPGFWDTSGGHLEPAEDPDEALVREMREELGIEGGRRRLAAVVDDDAPAAGAPYRHHIYLLTEWDRDPAPREGQTIEWWDVEAAASRAAPAPLNPIIARVLAICVANGWIP
jgi:8-oxo-dGTP diphosphatase